MNPKVYWSRGEKVADFFLGMGLWYILNAIYFVAMFFITLSATASNIRMDTAVTIIFGIIPLVLNLAILIFLGFKRRWMALGALASIGVVFFIGLCIGVFINVLCSGPNRSGF